MRRALALAATLLATGTALSACGSSAPPQASGKAGGHSTTTSSVPRSTTTTTLLPLGQEAPASAVPWNEVGPGWTVAEWGPVAGAGCCQAPAAGQPSQSNETITLYLVNPDGGRYQVTTFPAGDSLEGWSPDGTRVLMLGNTTSTGTTVTELTLKSGQSHTFTVAGGPDAVHYTEPDAHAILVTSNASTNTLSRYSLTGTLQQTYPTSFPTVGAFSGSSLETPDGTELVMGARTGIAVVSNSGSVVNTVSIPGADTCMPQRWWSTGVVATGCIDAASGFERLWLIPIAGGAPSAMTDLAPAGSSDAGDQDAWQVGSSTYLQDAGGCAYEYLAELNPTTHLTSAVTVPDVVSGDSQFVLGTEGDQIALLATVACGSGVSLLWYSPTTNTSTVFLGPGVNGGGVVGALLFGTDNGTII